MDAYERSHPILSVAVAGRAAEEQVQEVEPARDPVAAARRYVAQLPRERLRDRLLPVPGWEPAVARVALERAVAAVAVANGLVIDLDESALELARRLRELRLISPPAADAVAALLPLLTPPADAASGSSAATLARPLVNHLKRRAAVSSPEGVTGTGDFDSRRRQTLWVAN